MTVVFFLRQSLLGPRCFFFAKFYTSKVVSLVVDLLLEDGFAVFFLLVLFAAAAPEVGGTEVLRFLGREGFFKHTCVVLVQ